MPRKHTGGMVPHQSILKLVRQLDSYFPASFLKSSIYFNRLSRYTIGLFSLNGTELSLNSVYSENLINY